MRILDLYYCVLYSVYYMTSEALSDAELFDNLRIELRSGCVIVAALAQLRTEHSGYTLRKALSEVGMDIEENTLYPLLRRLESQGLLLSEWREENKRRKRFYRLSAKGKRTLAYLLDEWDGLNRALNRIIHRAA